MGFAIVFRNKFPLKLYSTSHTLHKTLFFGGSPKTFVTLTNIYLHGLVVKLPKKYVYYMV